jgi:hypothetical protein
VFLIFDKIDFFENNEKQMPSPAPLTDEQCTAQLQALGAQIRAQRKALAAERDGDGRGRRAVAGDAAPH